VVSCLRLAKKSLQLAPHHFYRVEVWGVGRQEAHLSLGLLDQAQGVFAFVGAEVVHDNDICWAERGDEDLAHIGMEDLGIGGPLNSHAGGGTIQPHRGDHRGGAPMSVRSVANQSFTAQRATPQTRHVGLGRRLVDEDQPGRVEPALAAPPPSPGQSYIGALLLGRMQCLFLYVIPSRPKAQWIAPMV